MAGQVFNINLRPLRLLILEQEMVVIPYKLISSTKILNLIQPNRIHADRIRIGFSYNNPANQARQMLKGTALESKGILLDPEPLGLTLNYDDSAVSYMAQFIIRDYANVEQVREHFMTRVWYHANEIISNSISDSHGVKFPWSFQPAEGDR